MLTLERAKELLNTTTTEEHLFLHAKNVMAAMGGLAKHFKSLFTVDELTGIIQAAARMRPAGITDMEVGSFMKKFKDKKFAAKCKRDLIRQGCEMLGMEVRDVASICIEAMKEYADELQLGVKIDDKSSNI